VKESPEPESATGAEPTSGAKSNAAADEESASQKL
jgi:hypothetical protein